MFLVPSTVTASNSDQGPQPGVTWAAQWKTMSTPCTAGTSVSGCVTSAKTISALVVFR